MNKIGKIINIVILIGTIVFLCVCVGSYMHETRQKKERDKEWEAFWAEKTDRLAEEVEERKDELKEELSNKVEGDIIEFGDFCGNKEWIILKKEGDRITLLSKNCITHREMEWMGGKVSETWADSDIRSWLNEDYIQAAFGVIDRQLIETTRVENPGNEQYGTEAGWDTDDKVFLLSLDEMNQYFPDDASRIAMMEDGTTRADWWLRSTSKLGSNETYYFPMVDVHGRVGFWTGNCIYGVRPVLVLNLSHFDSTDVASLTDSIKNRYHPWQSSEDFSQEDWDKVLMKMKMDGIRERKRQEREIFETREESVIDEIRNAEEGRIVYTDKTWKENSADEWDCIFNIAYWRYRVSDTDTIFYNNNRTFFGNWIKNAWTVLKKEDGKALLVLRDDIGCMRYHNQYQAVTWEDCSLRRWLNDYFLKNALSDELQSRVLETNIVNPGNADYGTDGGNDTVDKVFLLSVEEANQYHLSEKIEFSGNAPCWLRTPGRDYTYAVCMEADGSINTAGQQFYSVDGNYGLFPSAYPAIWVRLD